MILVFQSVRATERGMSEWIGVKTSAGQSRLWRCTEWATTSVQLPQYTNRRQVYCETGLTSM